MSAPLRVLGRLPKDADEIRRAVLQARDYPQSSWFPAALQCGTWLPGEHATMIAAEVAAVRWLEVDRALVTHSPVIRTDATVLANVLRGAGFSAIAFADCGESTDEQYQVLGGEVAEHLSDMLRGRVYVVPWSGWTTSAAVRIKADLGFGLRAAAALVTDDPWRWVGPCSERIALFEATRAEVLQGVES